MQHDGLFGSLAQQVRQDARVKSEVWQAADVQPMRCLQHSQCEVLCLDAMAALLCGWQNLSQCSCSQQVSADMQAVDCHLPVPNREHENKTHA